MAEAHPARPGAVSAAILQRLAAAMAISWLEGDDISDGESDDGLRAFMRHRLALIRRLHFGKSVMKPATFISVGQYSHA